jgi:hypothetical protein
MSNITQTQIPLGNKKYIKLNGASSTYNQGALIASGEYGDVYDLTVDSQGSVTELANGTAETVLNGVVVQSVRPANELNTLTGSLDTTADRIHIYDASTGEEVWTTASVISAPEVFRNNGVLLGVAPAPYKVGIDYSTGTQYYVNTLGDWQAFPPGTTVTLTDLSNGQLSINASLGGTQTTVRPIGELNPQNAVNTSLFAFYDGTNHIRTTLLQMLGNITNVLNIPGTNTIQSIVGGVTSALQTIVQTNTLTSAINSLTSTVNGLASTAVNIINSNVLNYNSGTGVLSTTINGVTSNTQTILTVTPSNTIPLADGTLDTRAGAVGTSLLYARQDHIHPITKISPFPVAPTLTFSGFTTPTTTATPMTYHRSTAEDIVYRYTGTLTVPNVAGWKNYTPSAVAGYTAVSRFLGAYRTTNWTGYAVAPAMEKIAFDNYAGSTTTYMYNNAAPGAVQTLNNALIEVTYTLN